MKNFIIACGLGGCWSGYTHAKVINAESKEDADEQAFLFASKDLPKGYTGYWRSQGMSYQSFDCGDVNPHELGRAQEICGGRLKESAIQMIFTVQSIKEMT